MSEFTLYTKNHCPQCMGTKRFLKTKGIEYDEININENPDVVKELKTKGFLRLPILMSDKLETPIVGFDIDRLKQIG